MDRKPFFFPFKDGGGESLITLCCIHVNQLGRPIYVSSQDFCSNNLCSELCEDSPYWDVWIRGRNTLPNGWIGFFFSEELIMGLASLCLPFWLTRTREYSPTEKGVTALLLHGAPLSQSSPNRLAPSLVLVAAGLVCITASPKCLLTCASSRALSNQLHKWLTWRTVLASTRDPIKRLPLHGVCTRTTAHPLMC